MRLDFAREAEDDLQDIWDYPLSTWGTSAAVRYLDRIADAAEGLARGELSGTDADEIRTGLRRQVMGSHVIWFRRGDGVVTVVRVLHQSRDAGVWVG